MAYGYVYTVHRHRVPTACAIGVRTRTIRITGVGLRTFTSGVKGT